jgi:hypothetical protein
LFPFIQVEPVPLYDNGVAVEKLPPIILGSSLVVVDCLLQRIGGSGESGLPSRSEFLGFGYDFRRGLRCSFLRWRLILNSGWHSRDFG